MGSKGYQRVLVAGTLATLVLFSCDKGSEPTQTDTVNAVTSDVEPATEVVGTDRRNIRPVNEQPQPAKPAPPAVSDDAQKTNASDETFSLTGLTFAIPKGWARQPIKPGAISAKAVFQLAGADGEPDGSTVRITHFPGMKGMDEMNIQRWLSQVKQPDGSNSKREHANVTVTEIGEVRLTVLDVTGVVNPSQDGTGTGTPNHRMIAAIVDHPQGPHFVKVSGGVGTMAKWEKTIDAFLKSAKVQ